ncbi:MULTISPECIES: Crp/Fnr family transcriptional regulator [unclassified Bradyrhizobium]|uniref:Crp/Fnr family transcriptional regulator n=1 Tax=unclassified Bradyrhizobium TaxID=2631580 RepID=UPI001FF9B554|nr:MULTISPECIES: Crp/Fnr family transcriptional regulator [unclassified Bradyrhizobium]MCK1293428.1 Crp/Fnr family transcriptional regulator [Bradyrhizobium sp. 30]MCK1304165.1 Crp/Fnr family transcriptional regulator [Bradyrhizobium sp. 45]MCK1315840.1 Crp/Fnr family transcriptional regulator [Bradyrhizobium sp. 23]MCK1439893.1 Crp/Fnr family transcriptional regulator [Bradyrhizobium sp. 15]MCK1504672.1 Crp/Fnr family transcriptional regulator [Bradyrhizobium sp. 18]
MHPTEILIRRLRANTRLSDEDAAAIKTLPVDVKQLTADTYVVREGDCPKRSCLVLSGFLCRSKIAENGKRQILSFHIPGDIPDLQSLFLSVMDHDLATISKATLGFVDHSALSALIEQRPAVARAFWCETLIDAAIFREWIVNVAVRQAPARMAHLLAEMRERLAAVGLVGDDEFEFPVTQSELAEALGLSVVHVNRVLQGFRADGVLDLQKKMVKLIDVERVLIEGGFDAAYLHQNGNASPY